MRWIVVATLLVLSPMGGNASESTSAENRSVDSVVAPSAGHSMAAEPVKALNPDPGTGVSRKVARAKHLPKSLLSRTERHRIALLVDGPKSGEPMLPRSVNDEDADGGLDDLDLQSSFARPKVTKKGDQDGDDSDQGLSAAVKLRLFLARMKAVKAHEKRFS